MDALKLTQHHIMLLTCIEVQISPIWKFTMKSAFWEAPLSKPRSHKLLLPVGSSSTSSDIDEARRT